MASTVTFNAKKLVVLKEVAKARSESKGADAPEAACCTWSDNDFPTVIPSDVVESASAMKKSALVKQLRMCLEKENHFDSDEQLERAMSRWLVTVDFGDLMRSISPYRSSRSGSTEPPPWEKGMRDLVEGGFTMRDENGNLWEYVIFDKSSSMARKSKVTFIAKTGYDEQGNKVRIFDKLDEALRLGIDFIELQNSAKIEWSKYFAYRGLYLTTGTRVKDDNLIFDKEKVIVLKSSKESLDGVQTLVAKSLDLSGDDPLVKREGLESTLFDGEGIVSPEYAEIIREVIKKKHAKWGDLFCLGWRRESRSHLRITLSC